jgi:menaquinone-9 beta-reductase
MVKAWKTDVVVIGGGPAGLSAAIAAKRAGYDVCVVDRAEPPIDKACGEGLMPDGLEALRSLGVSIEGEGVPFRGLRFADERHLAEATFPGVYGLGLRRTRLHQLLLDYAVEVGVKTLFQTKATAIEFDGVILEKGFLRCRWIIGADGVNSNVRRLVGLAPKKHDDFRVGLRQHYRVRPWTDFVEVYWGQGEQAYVTPVSSDEVGVALLGKAELGASSLSSRFPCLWEKLKNADVSSALRGAPTGTNRLRQVTSGNVALIGDASASIDAISGDGLALAFRQAVLLGDALRRNDLAYYELRHSQLCFTPFLIARLLLLMDRFSGLREIALAALSARPSVFANLLAVHVGERRVAAAALDVAALSGGLVTEATAMCMRSLGR